MQETARKAQLVTKGTDGKGEPVQDHEQIPMLLNEFQHQQQRCESHCPTESRSLEMALERLWSRPR